MFNRSSVDFRYQATRCEINSLQYQSIDLEKCIPLGCTRKLEKPIFAGPCAQGVWDPVIIPRPMSRAVLFVPSTLSWASMGPLDPKVCSLTATRRILGGSSVDCRYGSRLFVHSKKVGFYPSICIWVARERTKAANIPTISPNLWFHGPIFHHMHFFILKKKMLPCICRTLE